VTLAVLVDFIGHRLDAPVFAVDDVAAIVSQHGTKMFDQPFGLRIRQVLTGNEDMLVKRHVHSLLYQAHFIGGPDLPRPIHERLRGSNETAEGTRPIRCFAAHGKRLATVGAGFSRAVAGWA